MPRMVEKLPHVLLLSMMKGELEKFKAVEVRRTVAGPRIPAGAGLTRRTLNEDMA